MALVDDVFLFAFFSIDKLDFLNAAFRAVEEGQGRPFGDDDEPCRTASSAFRDENVLRDPKMSTFESLASLLAWASLAEVEHEGVDVAPCTAKGLVGAPTASVR